MKLKEGKKYNLDFGTHKYKRVYYCGFTDGNYNCYRCNREMDNVHQFLVPCDNKVSYYDCYDGKYIEIINLGNKCIKKIGITEA